MKKPIPKRETFWILGINAVQEALQSGKTEIRELIHSRMDSRIHDILDQAKRRNIPVRFERRDVLTAAVGSEHHQGIALRVEDDPYVPIESFLQRPVTELEPVMVLDCVQDPQNLGALLRSACFLGAKGIVIPKDRSARITNAVIKVAAGAVTYLPIMQVTNLVRILEHLKEQGLWILGLDVRGGRSLYETDLSMPLAIVVGNEQKGLRPLVRRCCDFLVHIPAHGPLESLNAATAGAIALAEVQRQRSVMNG